MRQIDDLPEIELHVAFVWDCDRCGSENWCRSVCMESAWMEQHEPDMVKEQADSIGDWHTYPEAVICGECGATYRAGTGDYE